MEEKSVKIRFFHLFFSPANPQFLKHDNFYVYKEFLISRCLHIHNRFFTFAINAIKRISFTSQFSFNLFL